MTIPTEEEGDVAELHRRLEEAEETLRAIRCGEVDALIVEAAEGDRVYTLQGADHSYRALIEAIQQGAVSLSGDGTILYCNRCFAEMVKTPQEKVIGAAVSQLLPAAHRPLFESLLTQGRSRSSQGELEFQAADGALLPVYVALAPLALSDVVAMCMVVTDLTQQKQHQELQDVNRRKDEFLAMLAHELRNPLAPIQNAVAILQHESVNDQNLAFARDVIERQVHHLSHLVDDLLDVSRITLGKVNLQVEPVDLAAIMERAVETSRSAIDARHQQLTLTFPPQGTRVMADPIRLTQILGNLLTNAAKYTHEGGEIGLSAKGEGANIVIRVRDNGMGISADLLPYVFDLFTQGDRSLARSEGGLGIGLTLVRRLVEMHQGTVEAHSAGTGQGSEFVIHLPAITEEPRPATEISKRGVASNGSARLKIIVVEDNKDGANILGLLLRVLGHQVQICYSGAEAIEVVQAAHPHAVLLDIGLPGMNGYDVARCLRQSPDLKKTVLIAMTGYGQEEDRQRSRDVGFDHHLVKPVAPEALKEILASILLSGPQASHVDSG